MHLIQLLLPVYDNEGVPFGARLFGDVRRKLSGRFGGLTAFTRAPAEGEWKESGGRQRDDIVVLEVMAEAIDRPWWRAYREHLETTFRQDTIVVRAQRIELL